VTLTLNGVDLEDPDGRWHDFTVGSNRSLRGTVDPDYRLDFFTEIIEGRDTIKATEPTYMGTDGQTHDVIPPPDTMRAGWSYIVQQTGRRPWAARVAYFTYSGSPTRRDRQSTGPNGIGDVRTIPGDDRSSDMLVEFTRCCVPARDYGVALANQGTPVTPSGWIENTSPADQNPEALSDGDDATYGVEAYPNGVAGMTYPAAFVATGVYMRQKAGEDTVGIGGFGKNSAAAWHVDAWPASAGSAPPPWGDWSSAGVTIASFDAYSQDYSATISGAPLASVYRLVMDEDAYVGGDPRNSWVVYEFVLYEGGPPPG
jgi:hypothetical protein